MENPRILGNVNISTENFQTFAVGRDKGFNLIGKSLDLPPTHSTGATSPLISLHVHLH